MRNLAWFFVLGVFATACVEEEDILAYKYDPARLCLINPDSPVIVDIREVKTPHDVQKTAFSTVCSVNEERGLVAFQRYFQKGFVECREEIWGDYYWDSTPNEQKLALKCD